MAGVNRQRPAVSVLRELRASLAAVRAGARQLTAAERRISSALGSKITDASPHLSVFCRALETAFRHGLHDDAVPFFLVVKALAEETPRERGLTALIKHVVNQIDGLPSLQTNQGRGRYFLRFVRRIFDARLNSSLSQMLPRPRLGQLSGDVNAQLEGNQLLVRWINSLNTISLAHFRYRPDSVLLCNPKESIMELFPHLELLRFDLYLGNKAFLDFGWEMPIYKKWGRTLFHQQIMAQFV